MREQEAFARDQERYAEIEEHMADGNLEAAEAVADQMRPGAAEKIRADKQRVRSQRTQTVQTVQGHGMEDGMSF